MKALYLFVPYVTAGVAGTLFTIQQVVNAKLRSDLGSAIWAGFFNYLCGTLVMLSCILVLREPMISLKGIASSSVSSWFGGMFGALWVMLSILMMPRLGTATGVALIIFGQLLSSLLVDHFGLFGSAIHEISVSRATGAMFLVLGVMMIGRS